MIILYYNSYYEINNISSRLKTESNILIDVNVNALQIDTTIILGIVKKTTCKKLFNIRPLEHAISSVLTSET